jgi:hypothetical protein
LSRRISHDVAPTDFQEIYRDLLAEQALKAGVEVWAYEGSFVDTIPIHLIVFDRFFATKSDY